MPVARRRPLGSLRRHARARARYSHDIDAVPPCEFFARHGSCRRGRSCRHAHRDGGAREVREFVGPAAFVPPGGTLLRKLLHRDIVRETGLVLQCVTHILDARLGDDAATPPGEGPNKGP